MTETDEYRAHRLLQLYIPPLIIILGTFGNVFAFVILRNKAMLKFSTYFSHNAPSTRYNRLSNRRLNNLLRCVNVP